MAMDRKPIVSAKEVELLIAQGQPIVIHEGYALQLTQWIDRHPGGRLAILHMVGRDASDEINVYHSARSLQMMKQHRLGRIQEPWKNLEPPIRSPNYRDQISQPKDSCIAAPVTKGTTAPVPGHRSRPSIDIGPLGFLTPPSCTGVNPQPDLIPGGSCSRRIGSVQSADPEKQALLDTPDKISSEGSRIAYATTMEQKEIAEGILDYPSLDEETQQSIRLHYRALHQEIINRGLYQCRYSEYGKESIRYAVLFCAFLYLLLTGWYLTSAIFLGLFWQQIMFTAHDAGHRGITGNFVIDTLIGAFIADFCCGLSIGWWKSSHNVHHLITNMPEHDPDIQNIPLFSNSPTFMKSVFSTFYNFEFVWDGAADFLVPYQKYTYYPVMALARFNLYMLSWLHLLSPRATQLGSAWWTRHVELVFMLFYWAIFGYALVWCTLPDWPTRIGFVMISHMMTMILHVQITLSHWGMPTSDLGPMESFPQRQLRTTMDVDCPAWLDFLHGGLQFQAVHHLFPRLPRHNLREGQFLVREFCEKTNIQYNCYGFVKGNKVVLSRLEEVAKMVEMMVDCQKHMAETGESGLN
ncbi:delta 8-(E)-sphingolipid desaturase [Lindgomyces ingoldianus]|uniref:Delta 8-(E)-sphingolipid desaturase n=1 Tax=Lindgomyces ingoldianus TaxID=673940 RepID=A0ACB6QWQ8_9PLEO|nr:delta 8-(E)-sphingolipid desaturase [Lindgomyces ingoldianus]KAF2470512.1 delta 8-(E)-sphingolipid desaturase [Lindgomyces ingoldianus]